jgi:hypothetical protein
MIRGKINFISNLYLLYVCSIKSNSYFLSNQIIIIPSFSLMLHILFIKIKIKI